MERNHIVHHCDCREFMKTLADGSVDSIVTDPPYELGMMKKSWDSSGIAFNVEVWKECLRVLKPGGYLLAFGGTRTYHRMVCAIEDAGFEVRDCIMWVYFDGFPKSHNISKAIDRKSGEKGEVVGVGRNFGGTQNKKYDRNTYHEYGAEWEVTVPVTEQAKRWKGWGTAIKPCYEPVVLMRKRPEGTCADNVLKYGTGGLNIDGCRVDGAPRTTHKFANFTGNSSPDAMFPMKNIQTEIPTGRWPANLIHDGSPEVVELFPLQEQGGDSFGESMARLLYCVPKPCKAERDEGLDGFRVATGGERAGGRQEGSAGMATAYTGTNSPGRNTHVSVKPVALLRYLVKLVTPPDGLVFDPFAGSGTTGKAAALEGFRFVGCEIEEEYAKIAQARIDYSAKQAFWDVPDDEKTKGTEKQLTFF